MFKIKDVISYHIFKTFFFKYGIKVNIFAEKNESYSHFFSKSTCELDIVFTRTVNIFITKELFKLMML